MTEPLHTGLPPWQRKMPDLSGFDAQTTPMVFVSWDDANAYALWLSKETGRPVRVLLSRFEEHTCAGNRPSAIMRIRAGIDALHVPYKGSAPAVNDLLGGQISFLIDPVITLQPFVKSGKVRALAVTDTKRSAAVPDVPSYTEFGLKDLNMTSWQGLVAPAGTSKEIIAKLHREIVKVLQSPEVIERMRAQGMTPVGNSPQEFTAFVQKEVERWSKVAADVKFERQSL